MVVFNIIANPLLNDDYSKRVDNTIRRIFPSCMKIPVHFKDAYVNIAYFCSVNDKNSDAAIYTDNKNTSTLDFFNARVGW